MHTRTSLFSDTQRFTTLSLSTASDLMIMSLRRVLELLNSWCVPEHVLQAELTLPVLSPLRSQHKVELWLHPLKLDCCLADWSCVCVYVCVFTLRVCRWARVGRRRLVRLPLWATRPCFQCFASHPAQPTPLCLQGAGQHNRHIYSKSNSGLSWIFAPGCIITNELQVPRWQSLFLPKLLHMLGAIQLMFYTLIQCHYFCKVMCQPQSPGQIVTKSVTRIDVGYACVCKPWICWRSVVLELWLGLGTNKHLIRVRNRSCFGLRCLSWSPQTQLEIFRGLCKKQPFYRSKHSWWCPQVILKTIQWCHTYRCKKPMSLVKNIQCLHTYKRKQPWAVVIL